MATAATTPKPLVNDGKPSGKGKGGTVTQHGVTTTGYQRGCRCDECKAAMAAHSKAQREARKGDNAAAAAAKAEKAAKRKAAREAKAAEKAAAEAATA